DLFFAPAGIDRAQGCAIARGIGGEAPPRPDQERPHAGDVVVEAARGGGERAVRTRSDELLRQHRAKRVVDGGAACERRRRLRQRRADLRIGDAPPQHLRERVEEERDEKHEERQRQRQGPPAPPSLDRGEALPQRPFRGGRGGSRRGRSLTYLAAHLLKRSVRRSMLSIQNCASSSTAFAMFFGFVGRSGIAL